MKIGINRNFVGGLIFLALSPNCAFAQTATAPISPNNAAQTTNLRPVLNEASSGALMRATESSARIDRIRDQYRHPFETLSFFGINSSDTVIEIWPGQGWYSSILAPYLKSGGGHFIAAHFDTSNSNSPLVRQVVDNYRNRFVNDVERFGYVDIVSFGPRSGPLGPANSVDYVLTYRNIHNWMNQGWTEKAFEDFFKVLKPGGYLGIEEHRASNDAPQDPLANDGYVRQDYVIDMAIEAGFVLVDTSEINANPRDTKDHPFGVWTLPPVSRTAPQGQADNPTFDQRPFLEIGESDRMTLLFRKPVAPPANIQAAPTGPQPVRMVLSPSPRPQTAATAPISPTPSVIAQPLPPPTPVPAEPVPVVFAPPPPPPPPPTAAIEPPNPSVAAELIAPTIVATPPPSEATPFVVAVRDARAETAATNPAPISPVVSPPPPPVAPPAPAARARPTSPRPSAAPSPTTARATRPTNPQATTTNSSRARPAAPTATRSPTSNRTTTTRPPSTRSRTATTARTAPRPTTRATPTPTKTKAKAAPPRANPNVPSWNPPPKKKRN